MELYSSGAIYFCIIKYFKQEYTIKRVKIIGIFYKDYRCKGSSKKLFIKYIIDRYIDCFIKDLIKNSR